MTTHQTATDTVRNSPKPRTSRARDSIADLKSLTRDPILLTTLVVVLLLIFVFVLWPIWKVLWLSIAPKGKLSMETYKYIFGQRWLARSFTNSLRLGAIVATTSTALGFIFAFGLNRPI